MRLLITSIISSLFLLIIFEYLTPVAMGNDEIKDKSLRKIEEDIYNLVKDDVKENQKDMEVKEKFKKELRAPCSFGGGCKRRRSSSKRRRGFWGKKREMTSVQAQNQMTQHASLEEDDFDKVINDLDKLVENLKDSRKRT